MSFSGHATPRARSAIINLHDEEFAHYSNLVKGALKRQSNDFHIQFSQRNLLIIFKQSVFVTVRNVSTSLQLKNIYYLLQAMGNDLNGWRSYLEKEIPTLVQATTTRDTPPVDQDGFDFDEFGLESSSTRGIQSFESRSRRSQGDAILMRRLRQLFAFLSKDTALN